MGVVAKKYKAEISLFLIVLAVMLFFYLRYGYFASDVDWTAQHSVFPDYFRKLFYQTGKLLPDFAPQIGGGQNLFYFSYYGLLSPLILPSYFLPFVKMEQYIMAVSVLCILASVLLLYRWLLAQGISQKICFGAAVMLLLSAAFLYQLRMQWMFVNYMPFLILSLWGVDRYMQKRKPLMMVVSVFLMIMTSYYFSIGGILALGIWQVSRYLKREETFRFFLFVRQEIGFGCLILVSVAMSCMHLIPTAFTLLGRGSEGKGNFTLAELFGPRFCFDGVIHSGYGMGLAAFSLVALVGSFFCKKAWERMLGISMTAIFAIPFFCYLLNGGLYIRGKVLIPFLPLMLFLTAHIFEKLARQEISAYRLFIGFVLFSAVALAWSWSGTTYDIGVAIDIAVTAVSLLFYGKCRKIWSLGAVWIVLLAVSTGFILEEDQQLLTEPLLAWLQDGTVGKIADELAEGNEEGYRFEWRGDSMQNNQIINRIGSLRQNISTIYSSAYAPDYEKFRREFPLNMPHRNVLMMGATLNPIFLRLMGVKYLISEQELPYPVKEEKGDYRVYDCGAAAPLAYVSARLISEKEYEKLQFPYNQLALAQTAVTADGGGVEKLKFPAVEKIVFPWRELQTGQGIVENRGGRVHIAGQEETERSVTLSGNRKEETEQSVKPSENRKEETERSVALSGNRKEETERSVALSGNRKEETERSVKPSGNRKEGTERSVKPSENRKEGTQVLFLNFSVKNNHPDQDMWIEVGGERNKLTAISHVYYNQNTTFHYAIPYSGGSLSIRFGKGDYEISQTECYLVDWPADTDEAQYANPLKIKDNWSDGSHMEGEITVDRDGMLITSIPYEDGFKILIDGREIPVEKVNKAFIGAKVPSGSHKVRISFRAPGAAAGRMVSLAGFLAVAGIALFPQIKKRYRSASERKEE